jgi:hypothetical protein
MDSIALDIGQHTGGELFFRDDGKIELQPRNLWSAGVFSSIDWLM